MRSCRADPADVTTRLAVISDAFGEIFLGRSQAVKLALTCLVADGHLLIEDVPGTGKTALSSSLLESSRKIGVQRLI